MDPKHLHVQHVDPLRPESVGRVLKFLDDHFGRLDGVIVLPATPNGGTRLFPEHRRRRGHRDLRRRRNRRPGRLRLGARAASRHERTAAPGAARHVRHEPGRRPWQPPERDQARRGRGADPGMALRGAPRDRQGRLGLGERAEPTRALRQSRAGEPGFFRRLDRDPEQRRAQDGSNQPVGAEEHHPGRPAKRRCRRRSSACCPASTGARRP